MFRYSSNSRGLPFLCPGEQILIYYVRKCDSKAGMFSMITVLMILTDINECQSAESLCGQNTFCRNTPGSVECPCLEKYEKDASGRCVRKSYATLFLLVSNTMLNPGFWNGKICQNVRIFKHKCIEGNLCWKCCWVIMAGEYEGSVCLLDCQSSDCQFIEPLVGILYKVEVTSVVMIKLSYL